MTQAAAQTPPLAQRKRVRPRPTRRLCTHGAALLLSLLLALPAAAQVVPTGSPAADILLTRAIAEHRVFLTCSTLDPATHALILEDWHQDTASASAILAAHNVPAETVAAFTRAADPQALMPAEDASWADVKGLCDTHPDWAKSYSDQSFVILALKLAGALE